jgi:two-component sensor histidine kinase
MLKTIVVTLDPRQPLRPMWFLGIASLLLVIWTVGVFEYGSFDWAVFRSGVYVAPLTFKYQFEQLLNAWREHTVIILAVLAFSFTPVCRRLVRRRDYGKARDRDLLWLGLFLGMTYAVFAWDQFSMQSRWMLETKGEFLGYERSNYGLLFVAIAGVLGGWRVGLIAGLVNMFSLGWIEHTVMANPNAPQEPILRTILMQLWSVVGVIVGIGCGYWREAGALEFRAWKLLLLGTLCEVVSILLTLATTWAAPYHFDRFSHNLLATGPLLALLGWWLQRQASSDPRALQMTQSELALVQSELRALRAQMNPHFLINSLSVIHHLIRTQPEHARELLLDLSDVLQHTLRAGDFVTLSQEIEQTKAYLALEQARYTNRLRIEWSIAENVNLSSLVPTLTLQPLVENAVRHGIAPQPEGGTVRVEVHEEHNGITLRVNDDGVGFKPFDVANPRVTSSEDEQAHIALGNISERLRLLYGEKYGLRIQSKLEVGTTVTVRLPVNNPLPASRQSLEKTLPEKNV